MARLNPLHDKKIPYVFGVAITEVRTKSSTDKFYKILLSELSTANAIREYRRESWELLTIKSPVSSGSSRFETNYR